MISGEDSDDEQEIDFESILHEQSKEEEINYYDENLPHVNFYLKFQEDSFLQIFCDHLKKLTDRTKEAKIKRSIDHGGSTEAYKEKTEKVAEAEAEIVNEAIKNEHAKQEINLLYECGFCVSDEESTSLENEKQKKKEIDVNDKQRNEFSEETLLVSSVMEEISNEHTEAEIEITTKEDIDQLCKKLEETFKDNILHLNEHDEYTKKINTIFQKNKDKFKFSIERILDDKKERNKKCFICNQKKKNFNNVLVAGNIYLCYECKSLDTNFRMISLSKLINAYCLTNQDLSKYEKELFILSKPNPRGYAKQMKLFFLFQIKEIAIRKHGSLLNTKNLYRSKLYMSAKRKRPSEKKVHEWKKVKSIYSKEAEILNKTKVICDEDDHTFDEPICVDQQKNLLKKSCKKCDFYVEYMEI